MLFQCVTIRMNIHYNHETVTMAQLHIDLEWNRDAEGYSLLPAEEPGLRVASQTRNALAAVLAGVTFPDWLAPRAAPPKPQRVVRCGGRLLPYRPLLEFAGLFQVFANKATTADGVLDFIEKFGPLTQAGLEKDQGEDVSCIITQAKAMAGLLEGHSALGRTGLAGLLRGRGIKLGSIETELNVGRGTETLRMQLSVRDLLTGLWVQFGQALASGAIIRSCRHCGMLFEAGPGTGRRLDAKFCSDDHRVAFNSLRRSKKEEAHA